MSDYIICGPKCGYMKEPFVPIFLRYGERTDKDKQDFYMLECNNCKKQIWVDVTSRATEGSEQ